VVEGAALSQEEGQPRYQIVLTPAANRDLKGLAGNTLRRIDRCILSLAENPRPRTANKLKEGRHGYRHRVGDYRIIYQIDDEALLVTVARVRHRRDVYRRES